MNVQTVMFGFHDSRTDRFVPIGFSMLFGSGFASHYRIDLDDLNLPELFRFTVENLPLVIQSKIVETMTGGTQINSLYDFLLEQCFDGVGSLRCKQADSMPIEPVDIDLFVNACREIVDRELVEYRKGLRQFSESCAPRWDRIPHTQPEVTLPIFAPA